MTTSNLADRYFAAMRARDLAGLKLLFAADATMVLPDGRELGGAEAILRMFAGLFAAQPPSPTPVAMVAGPQAIATEIVTTLPDGTTRRTANFFHLNSEGRIERLSVYTRSA
jgi:ketosteroid isomerase-like protein